MKNRFLTTIICILIAIVLIIGGCLGLVSAIKSARAVVKCGDIMVDDETLICLASYYKGEYIDKLCAAGIEASDTEEFWQSKADNGKSWGEIFVISFKEYMTNLVAAANIYISYSTYTAEDKLSVAMTCDDILKDAAEGSVKIFNEEHEEHGFDYTDFQNTAALIYKARAAKTVTSQLTTDELKDAWDKALSLVEFSDRYENLDPLAVPYFEALHIGEFK